MEYWKIPEQFPKNLAKFPENTNHEFTWCQVFNINLFTQFHATDSFYMLNKYQKTSGFLIFSGVIKRFQWNEMGVAIVNWKLIYICLFKFQEIKD